jgi:hypothetical protein
MSVALIVAARYRSPRRRNSPQPSPNLPSMLRHPLKGYAERKTSAMLTRVGWEPPQTWSVPRPERAPLVFQTRLPAADFVKPDDLPEDERRAPASVGGEVMPLPDAARAENVFLAVALCSHGESRSVLATMTAALAPRPLPFLGRDGTEQRRKARRKVKNIVGRVTVIERLEGDPPPPADPDAAAPEPPPLTVQYAVKTGYGVLTLTFHGEGHGIAENFGRRLFMDVVRGSYLGAKPLVDPAPAS